MMPRKRLTPLFRREAGVGGHPSRAGLPSLGDADSVFGFSLSFVIGTCGRAPKMSSVFVCF